MALTSSKLSNNGIVLNSSKLFQDLQFKVGETKLLRCFKNTRSFVQVLITGMAFLSLWKMDTVGPILAEFLERLSVVAVYNHPYIAASTVLLVLVWYYVSRPLDRVKDLTAVGFYYLEKPARRRRRSLTSLVKERCGARDPGDLPPVFPNGWIPLLESRDLQAGETKPISALGKEFAVFRTESGEAHVLDAFCPHLGAHLAVGGRVFGNCLECPFHGWKFRGSDGVCTSIPYAAKVPDTARIKTWPSCETSGFIFVWYHAEDEAPLWQVPEVPEIDKGQWKYKGRTEIYLRSHPQEISENGADLTHLTQIHTAGVLSGNNLKTSSESKFWEFFKHEWKLSWEPDLSPNEHVATVHLTTCAKLFGFTFGLFGMNLIIKQVGPCIVQMFLKSFFGEGVLCQYVTPEAPRQQRIVNQLYMVPRCPQTFANFFLFAEVTMLERDIFVWNNKRYRRSPLLPKEDKLISRHRRWYSQFYSQNSPTLESFRSKTLDW